jgi:hypothetical protein
LGTIPSDRDDENTRRSQLIAGEPSDAADSVERKKGLGAAPPPTTIAKQLATPRSQPGGQDKASNEAKDFLTAEPQEKLKELAKPESVMQCMRPIQHAEATDGEVGHHVSVGCLEIQDKAEKAHSSH